MLSATDNGFVWVLLSIFIPSQIAVMILMSKFSKTDGVVDVLDDRIGMLGRAIFSQPHFKSDALRLKSELLERLSEQNCSLSLLDKYSEIADFCKNIRTLYFY